MAEETMTPNPQPPAPDVDTQSALPSGTDLGAIQQQTGQDSFTARPGERNTELEQANRDRMLQSGELTADANEQLAMEKVNLATYGVENPSFGATLSSDPIREDFNNKTKQVQQDLSTTQAQMEKLKTPEYQLYENFTGEYEQAREENRNIFDKTVENIQLDFEVREAEQRDANRKQSGDAAKSLARMGAFGRTGSSLSFLQSVDMQNQREMNKLLVQKSSILIQAAEAAQAKDVELLGKLVAESHAITKQYNEVQSQRFQDSIMKNDQLMEQNRFGWEAEDRALGKLSLIAETGGDISDSEIAELEEKAGLPSGFYADLKVAQDKAKVEDEVMKDLEFQKSIAELLSNVPEGRKIKIGDQVLDGWQKEKDNIWKTTMTDSRGNVTGVTYDPATGDWKTHSLGNVGASKDGWSIIEADGKKWRVNSLTGETQPITTKGGNQDPSLLNGFDEWASSMGSITVGFGESTVHPNNPGGGESFHPGFDIAPPGAMAGEYKVTAFLPDGMSGTVVKVHNADDNAYGKYVEIQDEEGRIWKYSHLHSVGVEVGQSISHDSYLGQMGNTGNTFSSRGSKEEGYGTHLDLRLYQPKEQLSATTKPETIPVSNDIYTSAKQGMEALKGGDGYVDARMYNDLYEIWKTEFKNGDDEFLKLFPPSEWLNPAQPESDYYLKITEKSSGGGGIQIDSSAFADAFNSE